MRAILNHTRTYLRWYILLLLCILSIVLWSVILGEGHNGILTFAVLDIGQGDSLFIESPTGTQVIIDGGPDKNLMREIAQIIPWYDRHIDMLVVTNPDKDHYQGFIPLLDKYKVDVVLESGTQSPTPTYAYLEKEIASRETVEACVHLPLRETSDNATNKINEFRICVKTMMRKCLEKSSQCPQYPYIRLSTRKDRPRRWRDTRSRNAKNPLMFKRAFC